MRVDLTTQEYARLYAALVDCDYCGAKRGEFCRRGAKVYDKTWHGDRGRAVEKIRTHHQSLYRELRDQIIQARQPEWIGAGC
jgi:hypothetical protein